MPNPNPNPNTPAGIIHPASHPEDRPPPETEDDMYLSIFQYLERVFAAVRPRKLLFMAIDGVAPRAKMNQQRARRFKSAQEAQEKEDEEARLRAEWAAEGRPVPPPKEGRPFDSNVITPGTPFMDRLAVFLRVYIHKKLSTDPGWRGITVILSDGSVPGEGEHKIMEYIRRQRTEPGYDPQTSHVIHGLDADLIMLALATHEPHFCILREYVGPADAKPKAGLTAQVEAALLAPQVGALEAAPSASEEPPTPFQFLSIAVLREYIQKEFAVGDYTCAGGFDLERVIDDFIFLCFFVGNDFLPHMPSLDIRDGAIDTLCHLYRTGFSLLGGWITNGGEVDLGRAQIFCRELGRMEDELLRNRRRTELRMKQRDREKQAERVADASGRKACERRLAEMRSQLAASARLPNPSPHLQAMGHPSAGADPARVLGRDAQLFRLFEQIANFAAKPEGAPSEMLPSGLSPFERAKAYQCCDEYGVAHESKGRGGPNQVRVRVRIRVRVRVRVRLCMGR